MPDMIKVSAQSLTTAVAGAIAGVVRDHGRADVQAIGASAVNQAVKAIAIAHGYLEEDELDIYCLPAFVEVDIGGQERTAIRFAVEVQGNDFVPRLAGGQDGSDSHGKRGDYARRARGTASSAHPNAGDTQDEHASGGQAQDDTEPPFGSVSDSGERGAYPYAEEED